MLVEFRLFSLRSGISIYVMPQYSSSCHLAPARNAKRLQSIGADVDSKKQISCVYGIGIYEQATEGL